MTRHVPSRATRKGRANGKRTGTASATASDRKRPWLEYVASRGLKVSKAREQIVEAFLDMPNHMDLAEILARVRRRHPRTSPATVYRTVKLMEDAGIAHARHFTDKQTLYEVAVGRAHHDHLICERCGDITEFADPEIERLQDEVARERGFMLRKHRHELFGLCAACRREE